MSNSNVLETDEFTLLLRAFNKLISETPPIEKVKNDLVEIKNTAIGSFELNDRQKEAIVCRCNNYLRGEYGEQVKKPDYRSDYSKTLK